MPEVTGEGQGKVAHMGIADAVCDLFDRKVSGSQQVTRHLKAPTHQTLHGGGAEDLAEDFIQPALRETDSSCNLANARGIGQVGHDDRACCHSMA